MRYIHLDVFTSTPFEGNQLAVYLEPPRDLSTARMQRIANEMNFSETTFVFPPAANGDVQMRIFTPASELPMAGHPTIGTTFALANEGRIAAGRPKFVFECGVGPVPVDLEWGPSGLTFAWMTQGLPSFGAVIDDRGAFTAALGVEAAALLDLPVEEVSCGVPFLFVPLRSPEAVDAVTPDRRALAEVYRQAGAADLPLFVFSPAPAGSSATVYSRMLAPQFGIVEDPATGGASGPLGCYLLRHGLVAADAAGSILSLQGVKMGRPSRIHIAIDVRQGSIERVRVGGTAVTVAEGTLRHTT